MVSVRATLTRLRRLWREGITDADTHAGGFGSIRDALRDIGYADLVGRRVLDIGCGDRAPLSLLFAAAGAQVDAIDLLPVRFGLRRPEMWLRLVFSGTPRDALRQAVRDLVHTWRYWRRLGRLAGVDLPFDAVRLHQMSAESMPFADDTFDVVVSAAVWEHVADVASATQEVNRVLSPTGIACIQFAPFPALQGGHHAEWHDPAPDPARTVPPWDHLRSPDAPLPVFLNRWRESQYRETFERLMVVERWEDGESRGARYLTPALKQQLADYAERDLLLSSVKVWARKRPAARAREAAGELGN